MKLLISIESSEKPLMISSLYNKRPRKERRLPYPWWRCMVTIIFCIIFGTIGCQKCITSKGDLSLTLSLLSIYYSNLPSSSNPKIPQMGNMYTYWTKPYKMNSHSNFMSIWNAWTADLQISYRQFGIWSKKFISQSLDWIPKIALCQRLFSHKKFTYQSRDLSPLFTRTNISRECFDFGLHEDLNREIVWRWDFQVLRHPLFEIWTLKSIIKRRSWNFKYVNSCTFCRIHYQRIFLGVPNVCTRIYVGILNNMFLPHKSTLKLYHLPAIPLLGWHPY